MVHRTTQDLIRVEYIRHKFDSRLKYIDRTATSFFKLDEDKEQKQIQADFETSTHGFEIGAINAVLMKEDRQEYDCEIPVYYTVGWAFAVPTTENLMKKFLSGKITEYQLFWKTKKNENYSAIYFCALYIEPEYRNLKNVIKLVNGAIKPLYKEGVTVFYDAYSKEGNIIGEYFKNHSKYKIISK